jgi:hypothetical protein
MLGIRVRRVISRIQWKFKEVQWYILQLMKNKKKEEPEEFFDVRVVKGMPDFSDVP